LPMPHRVREWAYAGLAFDTIAAAISLLASGAPVAQAIFPVIALGLVMLSYRAWLGRVRPPLGGSDPRPSLSAGSCQ